MSRLQKLIICGAGGLAQEILALIRDMDKERKAWDILGFVDDAKEPRSYVAGLPVLGDTNYPAKTETPISVVMGFADPSAKERIFNTLKQNPLISFPTIVHPSAAIEPSAQIDEGIIITRFCFVSINAQLGKCVFINAGAQIGHDAVVGDFTSIMPSVNISGEVSIGERCLIGVRSAILQGLSVGDGATVGIGSVVLQNVPENCTAMGYPARVVKN